MAVPFTTHILNTKSGKPIAAEMPPAGKKFVIVSDTGTGALEALRGAPVEWFESLHGSGEVVVVVGVTTGKSESISIPFVVKKGKFEKLNLPKEIHSMTLDLTVTKDNGTLKWECKRKGKIVDMKESESPPPPEFISAKVEWKSLTVAPFKLTPFSILSDKP